MTWALAGLLKRISQEEELEVLRDEAIQLSKSVNRADIAKAEQALIDEGYPGRMVRRLSAMFTLMALPRDNGVSSFGKLSEDHILRKIQVEHDFMRCCLADLNEIAQTIRNIDHLTDVSSEFRNLGHTLGHLSVVKEHIDREEDIIFPYLRRFGWARLCLTAKDEHREIRTGFKNLLELVTSFNEMKVHDFKEELTTIVQRLIPIVREHLSFEDELLYPISIMAIDDTNVWQRIKALSDEMGYCSVLGPM
jgi:DUF438 domain-containing protein